MAERRLVSEITYYVSSGMLNPTYSLIHFGWSWEVKGQAHNPLIRNILKTDRSQEHLYVEPTIFPLAPSHLTLDDLQRSKIKVVILTKIYQEWQELRCWTHMPYFGWTWDVKGQGHNPLIRKTPGRARWDKLAGQSARGNTPVRTSGVLVLYVYMVYPCLCVLLTHL